MFRLMVVAISGVILCSLVTISRNVLMSNSSSLSTAMSIKAMDFEVFGRVQGVFFRKYTKDQADKLGLRGWCRNTSSGTVQGHLEGPPDKVETMVHWLKKTGSPSSQIDKAEFRNQKDISEFTFNDFGIIRDRD